MYTGDIDILELLPQRRPFLFVDSLEDFEPTVSVTTFTVGGTCPLLRDGCLSEAGLMENIAQSCAARIGYINVMNRCTVKIGIIGSVNDFTVALLPPLGSRLRTVVKVVSEVFSITLVDAEVFMGDKPVASCKMKISLTDIEPE